MMKILGCLAFLVAAGVLLAPTTGCGCTLVGCDSGTSTELTVARSLPALDGAGVTFCRNNECVTADLRVTDDGASLFCELDAPDAFHGCTLIASTANTVTVGLTFFLEEGDAEDGDTYVFTITAPEDDDEVLAQSAGTVEEYDVDEPNGAWCGPTCHNATI